MASEMPLHGMAWHGMALQYCKRQTFMASEMPLHGMAWHGMACGMAWHGMAWHGMAWHGNGIAWHGMAWHGNGIAIIKRHIFMAS